jgi:hypothetical protein
MLRSLSFGSSEPSVFNRYVKKNRPEIVSGLRLVPESPEALESLLQEPFLPTELEQPRALHELANLLPLEMHPNGKTANLILRLEKLDDKYPGITRYVTGYIYFLKLQETRLEKFKRNTSEGKQLNHFLKFFMGNPFAAIKIQRIHEMRKKFAASQEEGKAAVNPALEFIIEDYPNIASEGLAEFAEICTEFSKKSTLSLLNKLAS